MTRIAAVRVGAVATSRRRRTRNVVTLQIGHLGKNKTRGRPEKEGREEGRKGRSNSGSNGREEGDKATNPSPNRKPQRVERNRFAQSRVGRHSSQCARKRPSPRFAWSLLSQL